MTTLDTRGFLSEAEWLIANDALEAMAQVIVAHARGANGNVFAYVAACLAASISIEFDESIDATMVTLTALAHQVRDAELVPVLSRRADT